MHHHYGNPPFLFFRVWGLYGVYPSLRTYGVYSFPLFSQKNGIHHSLFCSVTPRSATDRERRVPWWWCIIFFPWFLFQRADLLNVGVWGPLSFFPHWQCHRSKCETNFPYDLKWFLPVLLLCCLVSPEPLLQRLLCCEHLLWIAQKNRSWFLGSGFGQQLFNFWSLAVHWMARTSSLNCLSCRNPYQTPHSLNPSPLFTENPSFFTEKCFVGSPAQKSAQKKTANRKPLFGNVCVCVWGGGGDPHLVVRSFYTLRL